MWTLDSGSMGPMLAEECFQLLAGAGHGLVNLNRHPLPSPVRVAFRLDGSRVDLLPENDREDRSLLAYSDVTLEVEATDLRSHTSWRVVVTGSVDEDLVLHPTDVSGYRLTATIAG